MAYKGADCTCEEQKNSKKTGTKRTLDDMIEILTRLKKIDALKYPSDMGYMIDKYMAEYILTQRVDTKIGELIVPVLCAIAKFPGLQWDMKEAAQNGSEVMEIVHIFVKGDTGMERKETNSEYYVRFNTREHFMKSLRNTFTDPTSGDMLKDEALVGLFMVEFDRLFGERHVRECFNDMASTIRFSKEFKLFISVFCGMDKYNARQIFRSAFWFLIPFMKNPELRISVLDDLCPDMTEVVPPHIKDMTFKEYDEKKSYPCAPQELSLFGCLTLKLELDLLKKDGAEDYIISQQKAYVRKNNGRCASVGLFAKWLKEKH